MLFCAYGQRLRRSSEMLCVWQAEEELVEPNNCKREINAFSSIMQPDHSCTLNIYSGAQLLKERPCFVYLYQHSLQRPVPAT